MIQRYWLDGAVFFDVDTSVYPQAILITAEQAAQIEAGTHIVLNGQVVPIPIFEPTLEILKEAKLAGLEEEYRMAQQQGVPVTINGTEYRFRALPESIAFVTSGDAFASKLIARGAGSTPITLEPVTGSVQILATEYDEFSFNFGIATETLRAIYSAKKQAIEAANNKEALDAIDIHIGG